MKKNILPPLVWVGVSFALVVRIFQKEWISGALIFVPLLFMIYIEVMGRKKNVIVNTVFHKLTLWDSLFAAAFIGLQLILFLQTENIFDFIKYCVCSMLLFIPLAITIHKTTKYA